MSIQKSLVSFSNACLDQASFALNVCSTQAASVITGLNKIRNNPSDYQRVTQLIASAILLHNERHGGALLSKFAVTLLHTSTIHNFLSFIKLPSVYFYGLRIHRIDVPELSDNLFNAPLESGHTSVANKDQVIRNVLNTHLKKMATQDLGYRNKDELKKVLDTQLVKAGVYLDLTHVEIPLRRITITDRLEQACFVFVDIGCIPLYLQAWDLDPKEAAHKLLNFVGFSDLSNKLGQIQIFKRVSGEALIVGACFTGFFLKTCQTVHELRNSNNLSANKTTSLRCDFFSQAADTILYLFLLTVKSKKLVLTCMCITKAIGLISSICKPEPDFSEEVG